MAGPRSLILSAGRLLVLGIWLLASGAVLLEWSIRQESDIELISLPLFLVGLFALFEGYTALRRSRIPPGR